MTSDDFESFVLVEDDEHYSTAPEDPFAFDAVYEDRPFSYATEEVEVSAAPPSSVAPSDLVDFATPHAFDEETRPADYPTEYTRLVNHAEGAVAAGFQIAAIGADKAPAHSKGMNDRTPAEVSREALSAIRAGSAWGYRIELGERGKRPDPQNPGGWLVPLAIEWEGKTYQNDEWLRRWNEALEMLPGTSDLWAILDAGVVHATPSGGSRWFFEVPCSAPSEVLPATASAARWAPEKEGAAPVIMAELLTHNAVLAPTWGKAHPTRRPYTRIRGTFGANLPRLEVSDVDVLVALLDILSDAGLGAVKEDLLGLTSLARQVRTAYNAQATPEGSLDLLLAAGWQILSGGLPGEVALIKPGSSSRKAHAHLGGRDRKRGQVTVWTTAVAELSQRRHDAFAVVAHLQYGGDADIAARELAAVVPMPVLVTRAVERPTVNVGPRAESTTAAQEFLQAIANAEVASAPGQPMVLRLVADGKEEGTLLVNRPGVPPIAVDDKRTATGFLMRVAQPILGYEKRKDKDGNEKHVPRNAHSVPEGVRDMALQDAKASAAVPTVKVVAAEPVLLESGRTVSNPGFHRGAQVLITMPSREAARWAEGYNVPERPTLDEAQAAFDMLLAEVYVDFPFVTVADRVRAIAYLLTSSAAHLMPKRPGWLIEAPSAGTGKSLLREVTTTISEGTRATVDISPFKRDDAESEKAVAGGFLAGRRTVSVDNAPSGSRVTSVLMTTMLTMADGAFSIRRLATNDLIFPTGMSFVVSGNRIELGGDLQRRFVPIGLEVPADVLATERDGFRHPELVRWAEENRPSLLAAAHTILAHGLQNPVAARFRLASFEEWARIVGGALSHLTVTTPDGVKHNAGAQLGDGRVEFVASNNDDSELWGDLFEYLAKSMARAGALDKGWTTKEIVDAIWTGPDASYEVQAAKRDVPKGPLEEHLRFNTKSTQLQKVGRALAGIARERVAHDGGWFKLRRVTSEKSKKSTKWTVDVYARDEAAGRLIQLGAEAILRKPTTLPDPAPIKEAPADEPF